MQQNSIPPGSKLRVRTDGTIAPSKSHSGHRAQENRDKKRRRKPRLFSKHKSGRQSHALLAIFKGLFTILFITLGLYWATTLPFNLWTQKNTESKAPGIADTASNDQNNEEQVAVITPSPAPEPSEVAVQTTAEAIETPNTEVAEVATNTTLKDEEIHIEPVDSTTQTEAIEIAVTTPEPQLIQEIQTEPAAEATYTIKDYRATMFSDPSSADATQTPIARGATFRVLERAGSWVKIEVTDSGETGYVHIRLLQ